MKETLQLLALFGLIGALLYECPHERRIVHYPEAPRPAMPDGGAVPVKNCPICEKPAKCNTRTGLCEVPVTAPPRTGFYFVDDTGVPDPGEVWRSRLDK